MPIKPLGDFYFQFFMDFGINLANVIDGPGLDRNLSQTMKLSHSSENEKLRNVTTNDFCQSASPVIEITSQGYTHKRRVDALRHESIDQEVVLQTRIELLKFEDFQINETSLKGDRKSTSIVYQKT